MTVDDDERLRLVPIDELIERSSFGTAAIREHRHRTPAGVTRRLLATVTESTGGEPGADRPGAGRNEAVPYFFLSYARESTGLRGPNAGAGVRGPNAEAAPRDDIEEVRPFFRLLCIHLSQLAADIASDERAASPALVPGYLAGDAAGGPSWRPRMLNALSTCRVFVPLLSPAYLDSPSCRREWETFRRRDEMRRRLHPFGLSAVVPVLWSPPGALDLPEWASGIQLTDTTGGPEYAEHGIRALLAGDPAVYRNTVFRIARRIHDVAECLTVDEEGDAER
jgi:hypothetical protein